MKKGFTKSTVLLETENGNKYLFDRKLKKTIICHLLLYYLCQLKENGKNPEEWMTRLSDGQNQVGDIGIYTKQEIEYYYKKYQFLENSGFFAALTQEEIITGKVTEEIIKQTLANLKQITFEITENCNLHCQYCGYGKFYNNYDSRTEKGLDINTAKKVIDYAKGFLESPYNTSRENNTYIGFYGGEPLLNFPFVREMISYVNTQQWSHNFFSFSMTTNGLLLEKHMDFLAANDVSLLVSLDGDEANNAYRTFKNGASSFDRIIWNIERLKNKYPDYFKERVNFNAVLHNKNSVSDIYRFFQERFGKRPGIGALNTSGIRKEKTDEFWKTYSNINESLFNSEDYSKIEKELFINLPNIQDISTFIHSANDNCFTDYRELLRGSLKTQRMPTGTCLPFSKKLFLTVKGKILACERIGQSFPLGQADNTGVQIDFKQIAQQYNRWLTQMKNQCESCYHYEQCTQCIYYLDIGANKPICHNPLNRKEYSNYVSSIMNKLENSRGLYNRVIKEVVLE
jgi:uncharacterized protein